MGETDLAADVAALRVDHERVVKLYREAMAELHEHNAKLERLKARHLVPPGWGVDYLGDGRIKPEQACAPRILPAAKS